MTEPDKIMPVPVYNEEKARIVLSVSFNHDEWQELMENMDSAGANDTPRTHVSTYVKQQIFGKT